MVKPQIGFKWTLRNEFMFSLSLSLTPVSYSVVLVWEYFKARGRMNSQELFALQMELTSRRTRKVVLHSL